MSDAKPKKNFFKKPAWLQEQAKNEVKNEVKPDDKNDATKLFARSTSSMSEVIAEQKRKERLREEKKAKAQAAKDEDEVPRKRRKTSEDDDDYVGGRDEKKGSISPRRTTARNGRGSSPKSLTKRHEKMLLEQMQKEHDSIMLSDGSGDENPAPSRSGPDLQKKPTKQDESEKEDEDDEFAQIAARARERAKQQELERKAAESRAEARENSGGVASASSAPAKDESNPIIRILVYSHLPGTGELLVKRRWNQNFREVRQAWVERQQNLSETDKKNIYFTWKGKRIFDVGTCKSLGIKLDQYGNPQLPSDQGPYREIGDKIAVCATTDAQSKLDREAEEAELKRQEREEEDPGPEQPAEPADDQIKLIFKAKNYSEMRLMAKSETKFERFEHAFRSHHKIPSSKTISFIDPDGEPIDVSSTIEEAGVGNMEMIEVSVK